jgi:hypothetical protein
MQPFLSNAFKNKLAVHVLLYDKIMREQAEVILNHDNENVRNIGQGEA